MLLGGSCPPRDFVQEHAKSVRVEFLEEPLVFTGENPLANLMLPVMVTRLIVLERVPLSVARKLRRRNPRAKCRRRNSVGWLG